MIISSLIAGALMLLHAPTQAAPKTEVVDLKVGTGTEAAYGDVVSMNVKLNDAKGATILSVDSAPPIAWVLGFREDDGGNLFLPLGELDKAIKGMKVGGKRKITIPPELGFGELSVANIAPNSTLIFEVEVFDVRKKDSKSEIKIEETKEGTGDPIVNGDTVTAHYRGKFVNGVQFDSSYERMGDDGKIVARPFQVTVGVTRLIQGFTQGLLGMKVGGKRKVTIPYDLAYGKEGRPPAIPPYSVLIFELEVLSVKKGS